MNKIKICCKFANTINIYNYKIIIYDKCNNIIFEENTNTGYVFFYPPDIGIYKIVIIPDKNLYPKKCIIYFHNKLTYNTINIFFNNNIYSLIKVNITDKNYEGLKITGGDLILWQTNM